MKKQLGLVAIGLAGLVAGAGAGLVLTSGSGGASAQTSPSTPDTSAPPSTSDGSSSKGSDEQSGAKDRTAKLQEILAPLVTNGTITQSQADAVIAAIEAAMPAGREGPHGGFDRGPGGPGKGLGLDSVAALFDMTIQELRAALASGQSLADIAKSKNVDLTKVTDVLVAAYTKHEQAEVASGSETQAEADKEIAAFKDRVDEIVNGTFRRGHEAEEAPTTTTP